MSSFFDRSESVSRLRMESMIGFQPNDSAFVENALKIISAIRAKNLRGWKDFEVNMSDDSKAYESLLRDRFGLNLKLMTNGMEAAIIPFFGSDNHTFLQQARLKYNFLTHEKDFFQKVKTYKGSIDLEKGIVSGDYSKGASTLYMNFNTLLKYGLNDREILGVNLHEIGHGFYPFVYANRLDRTNLIFEEGIRELQNAPPDKKREVIRKTLEKDGMKAEAVKLADDLTSSNPNICSMACFKLLSEKTLQHQVTGKYTDTNFEMMADNFAARFGFAKDIVTSLEKLSIIGVRWVSVFSVVNMIAMFFSSIASVMLFLTLLNAGNGIVYKLLITYAFFFTFVVSPIFFFAYLLATSGESSKDYTYDSLKVRYNRLRNQIIAEIKQKKLSKNDAIRLLDNLEVIGEIIEGGRDWKTPLDIFFNTFNPADRRALDSITRQQRIENLMNNELFVSALQLKAQTF